MKIVSEPQGRRGLDDLVAFLRRCREEARSDGRFRLAHISLKVGRIDPLAVLESIFEPAEHHFYLEKSGQEQAVAGADAVVRWTGEGCRRFRKARQFIAEMLDRTICIGDLDAPAAGPRFFCAFGFADDSSEGDPFPAASIFLPRWQVVRTGGGFVATANLRVDPEADISVLAEKVWRAHAKFSSFDYRTSATRREASCVSGGSVRGISTGRGDFEASVHRALEKIGRGDLKKVVLARFLDLDLPNELNPLHALNRLRMAYPDCYTYSVANGAGQSFIGASPELLVKRDGERIETEALAGSAPRGRSASDDAALAEGLLGSEKDAREHQIVIDSIRRRLEKLPVTLAPPADRRLLQLANVQHLRTPVLGTAAADIHLLDILAELHPTPAVGGTPREEARAAIRELEPFSRSLYAGAIGWIDAKGDGEFTVAIRSTLIDGRRARVFAGAGIVAGSEPAREWQETEVKLRAVLEVLRQAGDA